MLEVVVAAGAAAVRVPDHVAVVRVRVRLVDVVAELGDLGASVARGIRRVGRSGSRVLVVMPVGGTFRTIVVRMSIRLATAVSMRAADGLGRATTSGRAAAEGETKRGRHEDQSEVRLHRVHGSPPPSAKQEAPAPA